MTTSDRDRDAKALEIAADCIAEDWEPCVNYGYYRNMNVLENAKRLRAEFERELAQEPVAFVLGAYPADDNRWVIVYEDQDRQVEHFNDERAARHRLNQSSASWHCHLYKRVATTARDTLAAAQPALVTRDESGLGPQFQDRRKPHRTIGKTKHGVPEWQP